MAQTIRRTALKVIRAGKTVGGDVILIDIESLRDSLEFQDILGYINTEEAQQMKGGSGHVK